MFNAIEVQVEGSIKDCVTNCLSPFPAPNIPGAVRFTEKTGSTRRGKGGKCLSPGCVRCFERFSAFADASQLGIW